MFHRARDASKVALASGGRLIAGVFPLLIPIRHRAFAQLRRGRNTAAALSALLDRAIKGDADFRKLPVDRPVSGDRALGSSPSALTRAGHLPRGRLPGSVGLSVLRQTRQQRVRRTCSCTQAASTPGPCVALPATTRPAIGLRPSSPAGRFLVNAVDRARADVVIIAGAPPSRSSAIDDAPRPAGPSRRPATILSPRASCAARAFPATGATPSSPRPVRPASPALPLAGSHQDVDAGGQAGRRARSSTSRRCRYRLALDARRGGMSGDEIDTEMDRMLTRLARWRRCRRKLRGCWWARPAPERFVSDRGCGTGMPKPAVVSMKVVAELVQAEDLRTGEFEQTCCVAMRASASTNSAAQLDDSRLRRASVISAVPGFEAVRQIAADVRRSGVPRGSPMCPATSRSNGLSSDMTASGVLENSSSVSIVMPRPASSFRSAGMPS